jgi:hypothetical protein
MHYLGTYNYLESIGIHFVKDLLGYTTVKTSDKRRMYQSLSDWEKDFNKSQIIQKNALSNVVAQTLANSTLGRQGAFNIMDFLEGTEGLENRLSGKEASFTKGSFLDKRLGYAPVSEYHDNKFKESQLKKILEKQHKNIQEMKQKREKEYERRWGKYKTLRNKHNGNVKKYEDEEDEDEEDEKEDESRNKLKPSTLKHSTSLQNMHIKYDGDDDVPNIAHNTTQKKPSILKRLQSIFKNWQQSRSRVHVEKGGKQKTRKNKKKPNKRKTKHNR